MAAKPKSVLMREGRARRRRDGLVPVTVWIPPEARERLDKYVDRRLGGQAVPVRDPRS